MDSECKCTPNITMNQSFTVPIKFGPNGCQAHVGNKRCQETQTLDIIKEFHRVYESKLHEIRSIGGGDTLQATIHLQQDWIRDLTQQNDMLVKVVEELEKEATDRVMMLEQKLENTAVTGDKVMQKYRDNNYSIILIQTFQRLEFLENDVCNLLEFIKRGRSDNHWNLDGLQFYTFNPSIFIHECECTTCKCASEVLTYGDAVPEKANQNIAALNLQLNDMERRLSESPKPTDLEDLNFKLHLKDEELSSVKRSMLDVRNSLVVEVAEKHDEILTLRRDMSKLEEQCRQASKQFQNQDNVIKELRNEIILLKGKPKQLDTPKSVVFELAEQDDDVLALRRNIKKLNEDKDNVIKELRNELKQLKGKQVSKFESVKTIGKQSHVQIQSKTSQRANSPQKSNIPVNLNSPKKSNSPGNSKSPQRSNSPRSPKSQQNVKPSQYLNSLRDSQFTLRSNSLRRPQKSNASQKFTSRSRSKTPSRSKKKTSPKSPRKQKSSERSRSRPASISTQKFKSRRESNSPSQRSKSRPGFSSSPQRSKSSQQNQSSNRLKVASSKFAESITTPYIFLYEDDLTKNNVSMLKRNYRNTKFTKTINSNNDFYSSTDSHFGGALVNQEPVRCLCDVPECPTERCTLTANKVLHEYYGITGSHGMIKNFKEIQKVNIGNVPRRIPIKTYINNLELNIKTGNESLNNVKKKINAPKSPKRNVTI